MAKQKCNTATIILANGEEIHRVVKNVTGSSQYQQGDVIRYGQKIPVYRDLSMNPFWFEDKELPEQSERSTINVRFCAGEDLPKVGDVREVQGLAHWKYRVLHIINVSQPDSARRVMVRMHVERWIVEEEQ